MRRAFFVVLIAASAVFGYALRPAGAQTDATFQPFIIGQSVRLYVHDFHSGSTSITCKVSGTSPEFIGCEGDGRQRPPRWVNVRFIQEITPLPER